MGNARDRCDFIKPDAQLPLHRLNVTIQSSVLAADFRCIPIHC